jgi:para-aminobenzoate synthetase component I
MRHDKVLPLIEPLDPSLDPVDAFRRLSMLPHVVFFDSAMRHPQLGRWSFVAADPIEWREVPARGLSPFCETDFWSFAGALPQKGGSPVAQEVDIPFQGGWAGLFGYDLLRSLEEVPAAGIDEFEIPALAVGLYDVVVAFDHQQNSAWLISQGWPERDPGARRERASERLTKFHGALRRHGGEEVGRKGAHSRLPFTPPLPLSLSFPTPVYDGLRSNFTADAYRRAVRRAIEYIHAGDVYQVNLSQRLLHPAETSAIDLYCRLRERNPAPFAGYLDGGGWQLCSASPERFLRVCNGHVETRPIKGTRGRSRQPEADLFAGDELRASAKDRAENVMIVDLLRNDLSRTCRPESVRVTQLCEVESYAYVQHLVSVVEATLREECSPLDLLRTCFPGGSVTGAPKVRAMEIIAELEPTVRGAYCGSFGYIGLDGRLDTSILIRTITAAGGWWQLPVGGGIVADSDPEDEYHETWHKARGLLRALRE